MFYVSWKTEDGAKHKTKGVMEKEDAQLLALLLVSYANVEDAEVLEA
jgi:hypothetical protein